MQKKQVVHVIAMLGMAAGLVACGGGGGGSSSADAGSGSGSGTVTATLTGYAATGLALKNAQISALCDGATETNTTTADAEGKYVLPITKGKLPCLITATGTDAASNQQGVRYQSIAEIGATVAHISPFTHLIVANLAETPPDAITLDAIKANMTAEKITTAKNMVAAILKSADATLDLATFDPLKHAGFKPATTAGDAKQDALDKLIDKLNEVAKKANGANDATLSDADKLKLLQEKLQELTATVALPPKKDDGSVDTDKIANKLKEPDFAQCPNLRVGDEFYVSRPNYGLARAVVSKASDNQPQLTVTPFNADLTDVSVQHMNYAVFNINFKTGFETKADLRKGLNSKDILQPSNRCRFDLAQIYSYSSPPYNNSLTGGLSKSGILLVNGFGYASSSGTWLGIPKQNNKLSDLAGKWVSMNTEDRMEWTINQFTIQPKSSSANDFVLSNLTSCSDVSKGTLKCAGISPTTPIVYSYKKVKHNIYQDISSDRDANLISYKVLFVGLDGSVMAMDQEINVTTWWTRLFQVSAKVAQPLTLPSVGSASGGRDFSTDDFVSGKRDGYNLFATTVSAVDSVAQKVTRVRQTGCSEERLWNKPFAGMIQRETVTCPIGTPNQTVGTFPVRNYGLPLVDDVAIHLGNIYYSNGGVSAGSYYGFYYTGEPKTK
jgi:hypothetical protein